MAKRRLTKADLEAIAERLRRPLRPVPPPKETRAEIRLRLDARREAEARLREYDRAQARWEAHEDPAVRRMFDHKAKRGIVEAETRRYLRGEYDPATEEALTPAQRAIARAQRSEDEKAREAARLNWPTTEGWMEPTDDDA